MKNEMRAKIKGVGNLRVCAHKHGNMKANLRKKVITNGIIGGEDFANEIGFPYDGIKRVLAGIARVMRAGYEVRLGDDETGGVRFYPCLSNDSKKMFIASQTIGKFRHSVHDLGYYLTMRGKEVTEVEVREAEAKNTDRAEGYRNIVKQVTPDMMVTCPQCGNNFRIGKRLSDR